MPILQTTEASISGANSFTSWIPTDARGYAVVTRTGGATATVTVQTKHEEAADSTAVDVGTIANDAAGPQRVANLGGRLMVRAGVATDDYTSGTVTLKVEA